ncbi:hypothetical protein BCR34DRAFT_261863 [Clohesyomyces aquaticus]|uniref:Uncharacterized protein n=1 Tax=Clohesyomyces aquaticus TaxID=1231657 RepID=A0A1Y1ZTN7_9PLEO|nr:hypothetical protein BCR34DRAFT_261863 [Clohesyomyces aquaticus]
MAVPVDYSKSLPELYIGLLEHQILSHGTDSLFEYCHILQSRLFNLSPPIDEEHTMALAKEAWSRKRIPLKLGGRGLSIVAWVSLTLDSLPAQLLESISADIDEMQRFPEFAASLLKHVMKWEEYVEEYLKRCGTDGPVSPKVDHVYIVMALDWLVFSKSWKPAVEFSQWPKTTNQRKLTTRATLERAVYLAAGLIRLSCSAPKDYRLLLTGRGEFRIGPATVEKGDLCCSLTEEGPDIVIRAAGNSAVPARGLSSALRENEARIGSLQTI